MKKILYQEVYAVANALLPEVAPLVAAVGEHPELGYEEFFAAETQRKFLAEHGFQVTSNLAGRPTAFAAEFTGTAAPEMPFAALLTEYDALPELGHACGHQLIMGAGLLAALTVRKFLLDRRIPGTLKLFGTPAEEGNGGKVDMLDAGCFDGAGALFLSHPFYRTGVTRRILAVTHCIVEFFGHAAHASTSPEKGVNALDAMTLFFAGINAWRQQLPASARVHGIVTNGGSAANIIPDYTSAFFYVRSDNNEAQKAMEARFEDIVKGAALMTGCRYKISPHGRKYSAGGPHPALAEAAETVFKEADIAFEPRIAEPLSTDFANLCDAFPGVNLFFNVTCGAPLPLHSPDFKAAAARPEALKPMTRIAAVMAVLALRYFTEPELRAALQGK